MSDHKLEDKLLNRVTQLADKLEAESEIYYFDCPALGVKEKLSKAEAWTMACQALQVEMQGKQAAYMLGIQMLLTNVLKESQSKFPI